MSAIPVLRPNDVVYPGAYRVEEEHRRPAVKTRAKSQPKTNWFARVLCYCFLGYMSYAASSLAGNVMVEKARTDTREAYARTKAARDYQASLQLQVQAMGSLDRVEDWARANQFIASERLVQPSSENSRVAYNR